MPHYKDGQEAFIGDFAKGRPSNTPYDVVGRIVSITKGAESCNMTIAFAAEGTIKDAEGLYSGEGPFRMCTGQQPILHRPTHHYPTGGKAYVPVGEPVVLMLARDYGTVGDFELVSRPPSAIPCPDQPVVAGPCITGMV